MKTVLAVLAFILRAVVEFIKGGSKELPESRPEDVERVRKLEDELAKQRRARLEGLDEKLATGDRATADRVLRDVSGADDPTVN